MVPEILMAISGAFAILGAIGLFRFKDFYCRMHAATMVNVGGVALAMIALLAGNLNIAYAPKILLIIAFMLLTNPTTSHAIVKASYHLGKRPVGVARDDLFERMRK